jgi:hypothetical protein
MASYNGIMSPIRQIEGDGQVCASEGCGSFHGGEPIISKRTNRALLSIWISTSGICWGDYKNLEVEYEDNT